MAEFRLEPLVRPILDRIGFDMSRVSELELADVVTLASAYRHANLLMLAQLAETVGEDEADAEVERALALPNDERKRRVERLAETLNAERQPDVSSFAAHIATGLILTDTYMAEVERRGASVN